MQGKVPCDTRLSEILIAGRVGGRLTGSIEKNEPATWGSIGRQRGIAAPFCNRDLWRPRVMRKYRRLISRPQLQDASRHRSVDTLRGYVRDVEFFKDHGGRTAVIVEQRESHVALMPQLRRNTPSG
jgi:hypothetical protein